METKKRSSKVLVVIIVILGIVVVGLVGFILYDKSLVVNNAESEEKKSVKKENINSDNDGINNKESSLITFDQSKCLNNKDIQQSNQVGIWQSSCIDGISLTTDENRKVIKISVRWDILNTSGYVNNPAKNGETYQEYQITFNKNVEDIYGASIGFDAYGLVYLFLLDDGSVSYITFKDILENQNFQANTIENVESIVKFVSISYSTSSDEVGRPPTVIAYKSDGTFYDLSKLINM